MRRAVLLLLLVGYLLPVCSLRAQYNRPTRPAAAAAADSPDVRQVAVRDLSGTASRDTRRTPSYDSTFGRGAKNAREWGFVEVEYDSYPEWIDEMKIVFYALSLDKSREGSSYTFYQREVRYMDIARDREHRAVVYVRPAALERFGPLVAVAVEFEVDGKVVEEKSRSTMGDKLPADWWKNPRVVKSELVTRRDAYLLSRLESPFAFVAIDDYEAIK